MIVVDASVVVDVLLRRPGSMDLERRLLRSDETLHAPHLVDVEIAHVLRRLVLRGMMTDRRGTEALDDLAILPIGRHAHGPLLATAWRLRDNVSA